MLVFWRPQWSLKMNKHTKKSNNRQKKISNTEKKILM